MEILRERERNEGNGREDMEYRTVVYAILIGENAICNMEYGVWNLEFVIWNLGY